MVSRTSLAGLGANFGWRTAAALLLAALAACGGGDGDGGGGGQASGGPVPSAPSGAAPIPVVPPVNGGTNGSEGEVQASDFRVNETAEVRQTGARFDGLSGSGLVAVWAHPSTGEVRMQRFDAAGKRAAAETVVSTGTVPDLAALADGGFVVTWTDLRGVDGETAHVQVFDSDGSRRGTGFSSTHSPPLGYAARPSGLPDGRFVLAFDARTDLRGTDYGAVQLFSAAGTPETEPEIVNADLTDNLTHVQGIVAAPHGAGFAAAWTLSAPAGSELVLGLFDTDGRPSGPPLIIDTGTAEKRSASLAALADGSLVVAWSAFEVDGGETRRTLWIERLDSSGRSLGRQSVAIGPVDRPFELAVAATADGGFVVASSTTESIRLGEDRRTVTAQRFDAAGAPAGPPETVAQFAVPSLELGGLESLDVAAPGGDGRYLVLYGSWSPARAWDVMVAVR